MHEFSACVLNLHVEAFHGLEYIADVHFVEEFLIDYLYFLDQPGIELNRLIDLHLIFDVAVEQRARILRGLAVPEGLFKQIFLFHLGHVFVIEFQPLVLLFVENVAVIMP